MIWIKRSSWIKFINKSQYNTIFFNREINVYIFHMYVVKQKVDIKVYQDNKIQIEKKFNLNFLNEEKLVND